MKPKRKRTVREMAQDFGEEIYRNKDHPLRFEQKNCPGCIADILLVGYRRGFRADKAKAMRDCGWGA